MRNELWVSPRVAILSLKRRQDRRNVALASVMWGNFMVGVTRFVDAIDAADYTTSDALIREAVEDGFSEFDALHGFSFESDDEVRMGLAPIAYAWSLCRYFRERSEKPEYELFIHDDMHGVAHKHFHVDNLLLRNTYNDPIRGRWCVPKNIEFACFLMNTASEGLEPIQRNVFDHIVKGVPELNLKAGFYSPHGARLILKRLRQQISLGKRTPKAFLRTLKSTDDWDAEGIFSTTEPLFVQYPIEFLGSDMRGIPPLQGHLGKLFSEVKPS